MGHHVSNRPPINTGTGMCCLNTKFKWRSDRDTLIIREPETWDISWLHTCYVVKVLLCLIMYLMLWESKQNPIVKVSAPRPLKWIQSKVNRRGVLQKNLIKVNTIAAKRKRIEAVLVNDLVSDYHLDLFCLTETWLVHEECVWIHSPESY